MSVNFGDFRLEYLIGAFLLGVITNYLINKWCFNDVYEGMDYYCRNTVQKIITERLAGITGPPAADGTNIAGEILNQLANFNVDNLDESDTAMVFKIGFPELQSYITSFKNTLNQTLVDIIRGGRGGTPADNIDQLRITIDNFISVIENEQFINIALRDSDLDMRPGGVEWKSAIISALDLASEDIYNRVAQDETFCDIVTVGSEALSNPPSNSPSTAGGNCGKTIRSLITEHINDIDGDAADAFVELINYDPGSLVSFTFSELAPGFLDGKDALSQSLEETPRDIMNSGVGLDTLIVKISNFKGVINLLPTTALAMVGIQPADVVTIKGALDTVMDELRDCASAAPVTAPPSSGAVEDRDDFNCGTAVGDIIITIIDGIRPGVAAKLRSFLGPAHSNLDRVLPGWATMRLNIIGSYEKSVAEIIQEEGGITTLITVLQVIKDIFTPSSELRLVTISLDKWAALITIFGLLDIEVDDQNAISEGLGQVINVLESMECSENPDDVSVYSPGDLDSELDLLGSIPVWAAHAYGSLDDDKRERLNDLFNIIDISSEEDIDDVISALIEHLIISDSNIGGGLINHADELLGAIRDFNDSFGGADTTEYNNTICNGTIVDMITSSSYITVEDFDVFQDAIITLFTAILPAAIAIHDTIQTFFNIKIGIIYDNELAPELHRIINKLNTFIQKNLANPDLQAIFQLITTQSQVPPGALVDALNDFDIDNYECGQVVDAVAAAAAAAAPAVAAAESAIADAVSPTCPGGTYCKGHNMVKKQDLNNGRVGIGQEVNPQNCCDPCPAGFEPNESGTGCEPCRPGTYSPGDSPCGPCNGAPIFEPNDGKTACQVRDGDIECSPFWSACTSACETANERTWKPWDGSSASYPPGGEALMRSKCPAPNCQPDEGQCSPANEPEDNGTNTIGVIAVGVVLLGLVVLAGFWAASRSSGGFMSEEAATEMAGSLASAGAPRSFGPLPADTGLTQAPSVKS